MASGQARLLPMNPSKTRESAQEAVNTSRRKDACRNHERVVAVAVEVFLECGTEASVPQIATRAKVRPDVSHSWVGAAFLIALPRKNQHPAPNGQTRKSKHKEAPAS